VKDVVARCPSPRSFSQGTIPERIPIVEITCSSKRQRVVAVSIMCDACVWWRVDRMNGWMDVVMRGEASWCGERVYEERKRGREEERERKNEKAKERKERIERERERETEVGRVSVSGI